jgi:alpha-1,2-mannosyltransferase
VTSPEERLAAAPGSCRGRLVTRRGVIVAAVLAAPLLVFQTGTADLDVYRHGAAAVVHRTPLYGPSFAAHMRTHLPFTYPPFAAAAAVVLYPLPAALCGWLWALATVAMVAWCIRLSFRPLLDRPGLPPDITFAVLIALLLYTSPVHDHLGDGQVDILLMTMCLADCVARRPRWPRGMLIGIAAAIKLVPGIFIPYLWLTGRRRAAAVALATLVLCEALAAAAAFGDARRYWTQLIFDTNRPGNNAGFKNQSLRGIGLRVLPAPGRTLLIALLVVMVVAVGLARARKATSRGNAVAGAALTGLVGVLASPVSWIHTTVWVLVAVGIVAGSFASRWRVAAAVAITVAFLAALPYGPDVVHGLPKAAVVTLQSSFGLICLLLVLALPTSPERIDTRQSTAAPAAVVQETA